jgi:hypothetical protein
MKMKLKQYFSILAIFTLSLSVSAQSENKLITKPTIMVFPFFKEGEDIRKLIEEDVNNRVVLAKIREAFDTRGYSTVDFLSKARNLLTEQAMNDAQTDLKTQVIQSSGADIAIEVEYALQRSSLGNSVKVILTAYESSTSASLANKIGSGPYFRTEDVGGLAEKAVNTIAEDFLNTMQLKFDDIVKNGKYMAVIIGLNENSEFNMSTEVGTDNLPLSDAIEEWIGNNSNGYHIQGISNLQLTFDQVRIPRTDSQGKNYTPSKFALEIIKFCNKLYPSESQTQKMKTEKIIQGNKIYINFK